jgi:flavin-dependent dehydrogenase
MTFDVLVTGAGPAGCAAAIRAADGGLKVALAERSAFPRDLPGEAIHPDVDALFQQLGVETEMAEAGFVRCPGWMLCRTGERSFIPFTGPHGLRFGYPAWRAQFDSLLLARARQAGVKVLQPARIRALRMDSGVSVAEIDGTEVRFRHLVDASGSNSWLRRERRLPVKRFSPRLTARFGYATDDRVLGSIPEFHEHAGGWTWMARVRSDCCQFVRLSLADPVSEREALPALPPPFDSNLRSRGADVTWRLVRECAGPGYFLCGDASAVLDPAAPSGVQRALAGGLKAADLILRILTEGMDSRAAAQDYREWCLKQFTGQARQLAHRYAALERPPVWIKKLQRELLAMPGVKD